MSPIRPTFAHLLAFCFAAVLFVGWVYPAVRAHAEEETLDLEALMAEALQNHPDLKRVREDASAQREVPSQERSLPDPLFHFQAQNFRFDDPGLDTAAITGLVMGLAQPFPFPGKLPKRRDVAEAKTTVADQQVELLEAMVIERVQHAYWQLHFAERALRITETNVDVLNTLTAVVNARFAVGEGAQQDALQAQVADSKLRSDLQEREQAVRSARRTLNSAVGRAPDDRLPPTKPPETSEQAVDRTRLAQAMLAKSPFLEVARAQVSVEEKDLRQAKYDRAPDLLIGADYRLRGVVPGDPTQGADMFSVNFGMSLPIWARGKQKARIEELQHRLAKARAMQDSVVLEISTRLGRLVDEVERLNGEIELYRQEVLPEADAALDASISDYQVAKVGFVSVLRNWETELDLQISYERFLASREERLAEVDTLTGALLERLKP